MCKFGLPEETVKLLKKFFEQFTQIEQVKIFGSRAKGNYKHNSDVDFVLYGSRIDENLIIHISSEIDELPTPYKYDILDYKTIDNEKFKQIIDETAKEFLNK